ncbi:MAG TPA: 6,7-dimethyl-8-ribityllumazine synthase [Elusimicrobiota bacterium]|nr:6,7-dimethyl-8-ribityllumazine synthase [Elusimicrobiota bacterium]
MPLKNNRYDTFSEKTLDGKKASVAVVVAKFNEDITSSLLNACTDTLRNRGVTEKNVRVVWVPGAFELALTAQKLAQTKEYDAVICLGCIIRGETPHDRYIAAETARGIGQASLQTGIPITFGVLTTLTLEQARARAGNDSHNKGHEAALAALAMVNLMKELK